MLVNEATFLPMWKDCRDVQMMGAQMKIPSLEYLMALKLHA
jgi:hypothetical protein